MKLATTYMGLNLSSPLVASASPLTRNIANIQRLAENGAGAIVLPSLFEEQIDAEREELERGMSVASDSSPEALTYFPDPVLFESGTRPYLDIVRRARAAVGIPIIASLNGTTDTGWIDFAKQLEQAGASGIELNIYFIPADAALDAGDVERRYIDILRAVKQSVRIPIAVKLSPYFSAPFAFARRLQDAGADALVLFNRFYQPDIDLADLSLVADLQLSSKQEIRLPLLWTAVLAGRLKLSLAASTGLETSAEAVKYLLAGADVVMTTSALLRHGAGYMATLRDGLVTWMESNGFTSLDEFRGSLSQRQVTDPAAFERANYLHVLQSYGQEPSRVTSRHLRGDFAIPTGPQRRHELKT
ncbi:MAG: dihydroorotate dehydrogenase-like protein [Candidatus Velthaea sp.]|jgi:dihydroorotate dehydrogenase (fumarate)